MRLRSVLTCLAVGAGVGVVGACGGGEDLPAPGTPAAEQPAPTPGDQEVEAVDPQQVQTETAAPQETELVREVFGYQGSGRDPFVSLLRSGDVRPLIEDLRVTAINFDPRYPGASVAVLRDTTVNRRYTVRVGDVLGRMRVIEIRTDEVMVQVEEFGVERQMSIRLRRRQEETQ